MEHFNHKQRARIVSAITENPLTKRALADFLRLHPNLQVNIDNLSLSLQELVQKKNFSQLKGVSRGNIVCEFLSTQKLLYNLQMAQDQEKRKTPTSLLQ